MHGLLARSAEPIGSGSMGGRLYRLGDYPGAIPTDDPCERVQGELYRLPGGAARLALLAALDAYEACADADPRPHEYVRCVLPIERQDGPALAAWVYVYQRDVDASARIVSGDYLEERT
ncbi:MAG: gamma-glutamylcyclotransferase [Burkholderiaceae bacterium]|nr:gamma-glutamylcyclotransferase [Burkholderiaceae bacterium]